MINHEKYGNINWKKIATNIVSMWIFAFNKIRVTPR